MSTSRDPLYRRHRFPPEVISYAVWLYFRFPMSLRIVEEMLAARGICGTNETVREWGKKSARRSPIRSASARLFAATNGIWMRWVISIAGEPYWLWRAVDQNGFVLDVLIHRRRDSRAAQQFMRKLLKSAVTPPRVMITDKLRSCGAARAQDGPLRRTSPAQGPEQSHGEQSRGKLSPADKATRTDHEAIQSARQAQRFLSVHDQVANLFHIPYPKSVPADFRRSSRERAFAAWREISKTGATA
jgi:putative transposase